MEWINGLRLDAKVPQLINRPRQLRTLATSILNSAHTLEANSLAHNDLQHANIIVQDDGDIKLVDYDAFYLPEYQGRPTPEAGHPNCQHLRKSPSHFSPRSDRFPALVILLILQALAADPSLWKFHNQDNLIFTRQDFLSPQTSLAINQTARSPDPDVRNLADALARILAQSPDDAPSIDRLATAQPVAPNRANQRLQPATTRSGGNRPKPLIICTSRACGAARVSGACPNCTAPASHTPKPNPTPLTHTARIPAVTPPAPAKTLNHPHIARIPPVNPLSPRIPRKRIQVPILPVIAIALIILIVIALAAGGAQRIIPEYQSLPHTGHPNPPYAAAPAHGANPHRHNPANPQPTLHSPHSRQTRNPGAPAPGSAPVAAAEIRPPTAVNPAFSATLRTGSNPATSPQGKIKRNAVTYRYRNPPPKNGVKSQYRRPNLSRPVKPHESWPIRESNSATRIRRPAIICRALTRCTSGSRRIAPGGKKFRRARQAKIPRVNWPPFRRQGRPQCLKPPPLYSPPPSFSP